MANVRQNDNDNSSRVGSVKLTNSSRGSREMGCGSALSVVLSDMVTWLYQWTMDSVSCICDGWQVSTFFYLLIFIEYF